MKKLYLLHVLLFTIAINGQAQVGINNSAPNKHSVLDLNESSGELKGLLIPRFDKNVMLPNLKGRPTSLLIYNSSFNMFFSYLSQTSTTGHWIPLNPFKIKPNGKLLYLDKIRQKDEHTAKLLIGGDTPQDANANLEVQGTANITGKLKAESVEGTGSNGGGLIPRGGIIMWSGTTVPDGWALCDGKAYKKTDFSTISDADYNALSKTDKEKHTKTPDLQGRFIMGAGQTNDKSPREKDTLSHILNTKGGHNKFQMKESELATHRHAPGSLNIKASGKHYHKIKYEHGDSSEDGHVLDIHNDNRGQYGHGYQKISGDHTHPSSSFAGQTSYIGSSTIMENRPAYYVLAFIMKL